MKKMDHLVARIQSSYSTIGMILSISAVLIAIMLFFHFWEEVPIGKLTRDPNAIFNVPFYIGFISQIGIFFWSASATICLIAAKLASGSPSRIKTQHFLIASAALTLALGLDDAFLFHEQLFPYLGIAEKVVYAGYASFVIFYLIFFRTIIMKTDYMLLAMALAFFGMSVSLDVILLPGIHPYFFEDVAKLIGIVSWLAYFFRTGVSLLMEWRSEAHPQAAQCEPIGRGGVVERGGID